MSDSKPKIVVIVGPTASGKTSLAIDIAKEFNGEIISSDSRQVYKKLDIGTEKVTEEEMQNIPHHLLDIVEPEAVYNASDFKRDASEAIHEVNRRGKLPIVAGGTFFYIDMLLERISSPEVPPNPELREELEKLSSEELYNRLTEIDSERASVMDKQNHRRLIRSIEITEALGKVPKTETKECPYNVLMLGIETDKEKLRERLRSRAQEALTKGLIEETKQLLKDGLSRERLSEIGLEYRLVLDYLDDNLTDDELIQKLEEKNWQYAKRQLTWLKRDGSIIWMNPENRSAIFRQVSVFLNN